MRLNPPSFSSIPILDHALLPRRRHTTRRLDVPLHTRDGAFACTNFMHHLARLPIPEADPTAAIAAGDEAAVRTDAHVGTIPSRVVASKTLFAVLAEAIAGCVNDDLVVAALEGDGFAGWVGEGGCEGVHVRFGDEFDGDGDVEFPGSEGFVVRGGDEAAVFVDEGDGVDCL